MRFYKIDCEGQLLLEGLSANPTYTSAQDGRLYYNTSDNGLYLGVDAGGDFYKVFHQLGNVSPDTPGAFDIGDAGHYWGNVHANNFWVQAGGAFNGDLDADEAEIDQLTVPAGAGNWASIDVMVGNIYASDFATQVFENGSGTNAWFRGDIQTDDGDLVLYNGGNTPTNATFSGIATRARYA
jgi:hypothetical protein